MIKVVRVLTYEFQDEETALGVMSKSLPDGRRDWTSTAIRVKTIYSEIPMSDDEKKAKRQEEMTMYMTGYHATPPSPDTAVDGGYTPIMVGGYPIHPLSEAELRALMANDFEQAVALEAAAAQKDADAHQCESDGAYSD